MCPSFTVYIIQVRYLPFAFMKALINRAPGNSCYKIKR